MATEALWNGVTLTTPEGLFPLGTDAILLADFVAGGKNVCDLCCGSGAVALMLLANDRSRRVLFRMEAVRGGNPALTLMEDLILYNDDGSETEDCRRAYHRGGD